MCLMVWFLVHECNSSTSCKGLCLCLFSPLSLLQWVWCGPPWPSSPPPERSCSRAVPHWCVWPAGASPQPGGWTGRWGAAAAPQGCHTAWRSWGGTATTAGAAPWASLQTSGGRRAQWAVRPVWMDRALSFKPWTLSAAQSRASATLPVWKWCVFFFARDLDEATDLLSSAVSASFTSVF